MSDRYDTEGKSRYRTSNLEWIFQNGIAVWQRDTQGTKTRLKGSWCELLGETGHHTIKLLEERNVINGYVGVDLSLEHIVNHRDQYAGNPSYQWCLGNLFSSLHKPCFQDVCVWNLDGYDSIDNPRVKSELEVLGRHMATTSISKFGESILLFNLSLDNPHTRRTKLSESLLNCTKVIADALSGYERRRVLDAGQMLSQEEAEQVDDSSFEGEIGSYYIYRSRSQRMANLRLRLF